MRPPTPPVTEEQLKLAQHQIEFAQAQGPLRQWIKNFTGLEIVFEHASRCAQLLDSYLARKATLETEIATLEATQAANAKAAETESARLADVLRVEREQTDAALRELRGRREKADQRAIAAEARATQAESETKAALASLNETVAAAEKRLKDAQQRHADFIASVTAGAA